MRAEARGRQLICVLEMLTWGGGLGLEGLKQDRHAPPFVHRPSVPRISVKFSNTPVKTCFRVCSCKLQGDSGHGSCKRAVYFWELGA